MAQQSDSHDKTEQPTLRRIQEARKKGQVPRSRELNTLISLFFAALGLWMLGHTMGKTGLEVFSSSLQFGPQILYDNGLMYSFLLEHILGVVYLLLPFLGVMIVGALIGPLMMGGWSFSMEAVSFKLEKINPLTGLKRLFSAKGLVELIKALFKFVLLIAAATLFFYSIQDHIFNLANQSFNQAIVNSMTLILQGFFLVSLVLLLVVAMDVPFELWNYTRQLRMTKQEVRDELKETEGKPEVKSRIRALQREASQRRMMQDVPTADVIITNPTHFAVALKYDQGASRAAPVVVAKGRDLIASKIRELGDEHDVTIFEYPPLARAIYANTEIGEEIPAGLFLAVAKVLAYVYQASVAGPNVYVTPPEDLPIPDELKA